MINQGHMINRNRYSNQIRPGFLNALNAAGFCISFTAINSVQNTFCGLRLNSDRKTEARISFGHDLLADLTVS